MRSESQMRARSRITLNSLHFRFLVLSAALAAAVVISGAGPDAAAARGLVTGFAAPLDGADLNRMVDARAGIVRVTVGWSAVAPQRPAHPGDPADPGYRFGYPDSVVRNAASEGLTVLITFAGAPSWAEGGNRPRGATPGSWKPKPGAVRPFAHALAARYSGDFTPPGASSPLPRVRDFEVWNEPNLSNHLAPQWRHGKPASPALYRKMLNAAYAGIKSARRSDRVVGPATAPYGEPRGGGRMRPLIFLRKLLCLRERGRPVAAKCPHKAHLDVLSHHPIDTIGGPHKPAVNRGDASMPELHKVRRLLRAAERHHTIAPRRRHRPLWATEFWWISDPPNPTFGFPPRRLARWMEEGLRVMRKQGASVAINLQVRDDPTDHANPGATIATGVFFNDGRKKPAFRSFSFPFVAHRHSKAVVDVWGKSPRRGRLRIERRAGGGWRTVKSIRVRSGVGGAVFSTRVHLRGRPTLRASVADRRSLPWKAG